MKNYKSGFTLIELLIVIALLGALAIGLMAALDPFEQLKKGTDTGTRNTVAELQGAGVRFYAVKGQVPWCNPAVPASDVTCPNPVSDQSTSPTDLTATNFNGVSYFNAIDQIVNAGELKSNFVELASANMDKMFVTGDNGFGANSAIIAVCFKPQSKSFQADKNTIYNADGTTTGLGTTCKSTGGNVDCFYCVQ